MRNDYVLTSKSMGNALVEASLHYNKCNIKMRYKSIRFLLCLALGVLLFSFGCKQASKGEKGKPIPSNEITITVKGDAGLIVKTPNTFKVKKSSSWQEVKKLAKSKVGLKENRNIKEWRLKNVDGKVLVDSDKFEKDEIVFAVSKDKNVLTNPITITIEADAGYTFKDVGTPCTIKVEKGDKWIDTEEKVLAKIELKKDYDEAGWKMGSKDGEYIENSFTFNEDATVFATSKRKIVSYKVEHLQENKENDEYSLYGSEYKKGEAGKNTDAEAKSYEGFIAQAFAQSLIKVDGSTVVQIKYKRKVTSLILNLDGGETEKKLEDGKDGNKLLKGKYGAKVEVRGLAKEDYVFDKWEPQLPKVFPMNDDTEHIYTAKWVLNVVKLTIAGDNGIDIANPNTIKITKGVAWAGIKPHVESITPLKEYFEIDAWHLKDEEGELLTDGHIFNTDEAIFAKTKRKVVNYKVEHLQENKEDDEYSLYESEDKTGDAGKNTDAQAKTYEGFITQVFSQSLIKEDGSTIVQIKYKRKIISLILNLNGGTAETELEDGKDGNKLLKGKYGSKVEVRGLAKEDYVFDKWEPLLPIFFPTNDDTEHVYTAQWKDSIQINIVKGDERLTVMSPVDFPFTAGMTWADIKEKMTENVSLKDKWQGGGYKLYDWRCENEDGDEVTDETILEDGMKVYPRSNYAHFKWDQNEDTILMGCYDGWGKPSGKIIIPTETTKIQRQAFKEAKGLTAVDFRDCSKLKEIGGGAFSDCTKLKTVDLRGCSELKDMGGEFSAFIGCTALETVNLGGCGELTEIYLEHTQITSIDLSICPKVKKINFGECTKLENVNLTGCSEIVEIDLSETAITNIDLSARSNLTNINFYNCTKLESANLTGCNELIRVSLTGTAITSIDLSGRSKLTYINSAYCHKLTSVNLTGCSELAKISSSKYEHGGAFDGCEALKTVNLAGCTGLKEVFFYDAPITSMNLSSCTELTDIYLSYCGELKTLNLTGCIGLTKVNLSGTPITSIDLSSCTKLTEINFSWCKKLASVDLTGCSGLKEIVPNKFNYCFYGCTALETVNLTGCSGLKKLGGTYCKSLEGVGESYDAFGCCDVLKTVILTGCCELTEVDLHCTAISSIDLSPCKKLTEINFSYCEKLESVDLTSCSALKEINSNAFYSGCIKAEVKLPASVTKIWSGAFGKDRENWCKKVLVPNVVIKRKVMDSGYPSDRIKIYH